ncbi:MAG TPA: hypothetical protein VF773_02190 [Verrucomicrobiae bacterium]
MTTATPPPSPYDLANLKLVESWSDPALAALQRRRQDELLQAEMNRRAQLMMMEHGLRTDQQTREFENRANLAKVEHTFRAGEGEKDRRFKANQEAREKSFRTVENARNRDSQVERTQLQMDEYFKRQDAQEKARQRDLFIRQYGAVPKEGESTESFLLRAHSDEQQKAHNSFSAIRTHTERAEEALAAASQEAEAERLLRVRTLARQKAASEMMIPVVQLNPTVNASHASALFRAEQELSDPLVTPYAPGLRAKVEGWKRELSTAQSLQDDALRKFSDSGADATALFRNPGAAPASSAPAKPSTLPLPPELQKPAGGEKPKAVSAAAEVLKTPFSDFKGFTDWANQNLEPYPRGEANSVFFRELAKDVGYPTQYYGDSSITVDPAKAMHEFVVAHPEITQQFAGYPGRQAIFDRTYQQMLANPYANPGGRLR